MIGLDFDNTIACYTDVFRLRAIELGYVAPEFSGTKTELRDQLMTRSGGEKLWQVLQGWVYGQGISSATLFDGVVEFLDRARAQSDRVVIVSHKTTFGHFDPARINLRDAAMGWMTEKGFFGTAGFGIQRDDVHFADTRSEKLSLISKIGPDVFVDDLEEVLLDKDFPLHVRPVLFREEPHPALPTMPDWRHITRHIYGDRA